jgi:hypothetical protein
MKKEIESAFKWLENRHQSMQELAASGEQFHSEYLQGHTEGIKTAVKYYGQEIEKIRQLLEGYLVEDVNLDGSEEHAS